MLYELISKTTPLLSKKEIKNIDDIKKINKEKSLPLQSSLDNKNN